MLPDAKAVASCKVQLYLNRLEIWMIKLAPYIGHKKMWTAHFV